MKQTKLKRFKRIVLKVVFTFLLTSSIILISLSSNQSCNAKRNNQLVIEQIDSIHKDTLIVDTAQIINNITEELIVEVDKYIKTKTNSHYRFIPKYLVLAGLKYDIDICFMMAQTQIETCYGTLGAGREKSRHSLFGVAYQKYPNYENAIDSYCKLLHKSYLGNSKTEQHLLTKYVTLKGARYAENLNYEKDLRIAYNHIKKNTNIYQLQQDYKNML